MTTINPWKTLSTKTVYQNPWIKVREDQVIRPDGNPGIYGVVETKVATGVVALSDDNQVYLVGQYRYPHNKYSWEIIEGAAEEGESPLEGAMREAKEEAGLIASEWIELGGDVQLSNCFTDEVARFFLARGLKQTQSCPEGTEVLEIRKVPLKQCFDMLHNGEFQDAMTLIALYRFERFLKNQTL